MPVSSQNEGLKGFSDAGFFLISGD